MDEAKLKQLAEQYTEEYYFETPVQFFMAGANIATREVKEENEKLKQQIEKMKLCINCVNQTKREYEEPCYSCYNRSKWSFKK